MTIDIQTLQNLHQRIENIWGHHFLIPEDVPSVWILTNYFGQVTSALDEAEKIGLIDRQTLIDHGTWSERFNVETSHPERQIEQLKNVAGHIRRRIRHALHEAQSPAYERGKAVTL